MSQHGKVKVAVYAYIYMLAKSSQPGTSYHSNFFAGELVGNGGGSVPPVVQPLLQHSRYELRTLGTELLAVFIRQQVRAACRGDIASNSAYEDSG